jgi:hypothetical protein
MAINLQHQTPAEFALRFWRSTRAAFDSGDKQTYHRRIWWLWTQIQAGDITSTQARESYNTAFDKSLTATQWTNNIVPKLTAIKDRYLAWQAEGMV